MNHNQTHTVAGEPAVRLPEVGDVYFLEHGGYVTGWAAAKRGTSIVEERTQRTIPVSDMDRASALSDVASFQRFTEMTKDFQGGRPL